MLKLNGESQTTVTGEVKVTPVWLLITPSQLASEITEKNLKPHLHIMAT